MPFKVCSYDCVYCQLGRTTDKTVQRRKYVDIDEIMDELSRKLAETAAPDYIGLAGSGEPTLNVDIGELIGRIKARTTIPVAVLTNGSLLSSQEVRDALKNADVVLPSLDAGDANIFQYVNRPHEAVTFDKMVEGLVDFTMGFSGEVWLEVFLLAGVTGIATEAKKIAAIARRIGPARVQLNTVARPPAEEYAFAMTADQLWRFRKFFDGEVDVISEKAAVAPNEKDDVSDNAAMEKAILALLERRPCSARDIAAGLGYHDNAVLKQLQRLTQAEKVVMKRVGTNMFYEASRKAL